MKWWGFVIVFIALLSGYYLGHKGIGSEFMSKIPGF